MYDSRDVQFYACVQDVLWQFYMSLAEAVTVVLLLIEYTDQVDHGIHTVKVLLEFGAVSDIGFNQFDIRQHQQVAMVVTVSGQYSHTLCRRCQAAGDVFTDKTGPAEYAY
jgi:hypothetical protein